MLENLEIRHLLATYIDSHLDIEDLLSDFQCPAASIFPDSSDYLQCELKPIEISYSDVKNSYYFDLEYFKNFAEEITLENSATGKFVSLIQMHLPTSCLLILGLAKGPVELFGLEKIKIDGNPLQFNQVIALEMIHIYHSVKSVVMGAALMESANFAIELLDFKGIDKDYIGVFNHLPAIISVPSAFFNSLGLAVGLASYSIDGFSPAPEAKFIAGKLNAYRDADFIIKLSHGAFIPGVFLSALYDDTASWLKLKLFNEEDPIDFGKYGIHAATSIIFSSAFLHLTLNYAQKFQAFEKINRQSYAQFHQGSAYLAIAAGLFIEGLHHMSPQAFKNYLSTDHKFEFLFSSLGFIGGFFHPKAAGGDDITWENFSNLIINKKSWAWAITAGGFGRTVGMILDDWLNFFQDDEIINHEKDHSKAQKNKNSNDFLQISLHEDLQKISQTLETLTTHMLRATPQPPSESK